MLQGSADAAARSNASRLVVLAPAGSGKTEILARRVAYLVEAGADPKSILATTFSRRGASEIRGRLRERLGTGANGRQRWPLPMVTTVHGLAHHILTAWDEDIAHWRVLSTAQLFAFIHWNQRALGLQCLGLNSVTFAKGLAAFVDYLEVVDGDLLDPSQLGEFGALVTRTRDLLMSQRLMTHGLQVARAVELIESDESFAARVRAHWRHVLVDEVQDLNRAQYRLLAGVREPTTTLTVIGDDDQTIYRWRGSDPSLLLTMATSDSTVGVVSLQRNWRSRPELVEASARFASGIAPRLQKSIEATRPRAESAMSLWCAESVADEAEQVADAIDLLLTLGRPAESIAVLTRTWASSKPITDALKRKGIRFSSDESEPLLRQPGALPLALVFAWLVDHLWPTSLYDVADPEPTLIWDGAIRDQLIAFFKVTPTVASSTLRFLRAQKRSIKADEFDATLSEFLTELLVLIESRDSLLYNGSTCHHFAQTIREYENAITPIGCQPPRGAAVFRSFPVYLSNFGRQQSLVRHVRSENDALLVTTIHQAKGLEWDYVFLPSVVGGVLPHFTAGRRSESVLDKVITGLSPYGHSLMDERRLMYVAMTRAREWVSISAHQQDGRGPVSASPFFTELKESHGDTGYLQVPMRTPSTPGWHSATRDGEPRGHR